VFKNGSALGYSIQEGSVQAKDATSWRACYHCFCMIAIGCTSLKQINRDHHAEQGRGILDHGAESLPIVRELTKGAARFVSWNVLCT
jgi:hypothetical protein